MAKQHGEARDCKDSPTTPAPRMAVALPAAAPSSAGLAAADGTLARLITRAAEKNAAFMRGDMERWANLANIAPAFTLMQPFGGPVGYGYDTSPKRLGELAQYFKNGETTLEVAQTYASDGLVVLVMIERQHAEVGDLPRQDWSLRVTEVFRRDGADWQLAHRHADPLVRRITLEQAAALARGPCDDV